MKKLFLRKEKCLVFCIGFCFIYLFINTDELLPGKKDLALWKLPLLKQLGPQTPAAFALGSGEEPETALQALHPHWASPLLHIKLWTASFLYSDWTEKHTLAVTRIHYHQQDANTCESEGFKDIISWTIYLRREQNENKTVTRTSII